MTDQVRQKLLHALAELSAEAPQLRMGQLIANLSYLALGPANESIWEVEDEELLTAAARQLETLKGRTSSADRVAG
jgi:hypothetical protein